MKNILAESDDNNFEIKKYKFNPVFKGKTKTPNSDNNNNINIYEETPYKKVYQNANPFITDSSLKDNTMNLLGESPTLNKQKANTQKIKTKLNDKEQYLKQEEDINILRNNFKEKINLLEEDYNKKILKMEEKNNQLIENIKELYKNKINEIKNQMGQNLNKINKQNLDLINEIRIIRANSIPLQEHYEKLNDLNSKWEEKFKNYRKNYENKYKQISKKIEKELPLDKIFAEINSSTTSDNIIKMIKLIELRNKIGYFTFILNLQEKYSEEYEKFDEINREKIKNLKKYAIQRFDDILKDKNGDKNYGKKTSGALSNLDIDNTYLKKSELVNYESFFKNENDKCGINNNNDGNNVILSVSKSLSVSKDKYSSDLESFNFNDDSIPNKDIQILSPPELIK